MTTDTKRSFFATTTGIVTGLAGLITAVVGVLTVGVQLGWFGSDDAVKSDTTVSTTAPANTAANTGAASFTVDPDRVVFEVLGPKESLVTVNNRSSTAITWRPVTVAGADRAAFTASDVSCGARLDPGRSCQVRVRFAPSRNGDYAAKLVLQPENGPAREVDLVGKALL